VPLFSALLVATAFVTWRRAATPALRRLAAALVGLLVVQISWVVSPCCWGCPRW